MRIVSAARLAPSVTAGRIRNLKWSQAKANALEPPDGSQRRWTANSAISRIPSQKFGIDSPSSDRRRAPVSTGPLRRVAESTPSGIAITTDTRSAASVSSRVSGKRSRISSRTGRRLR
jgi:hypothetical protein